MPDTAAGSEDRRTKADHGALMAFLADSAQDLSSSLQLDELFTKIARRVQQVIDSHLLCIMLWNEESGLLEHSYSLRYGEHVRQTGGFPLGYGLSGSAAEDRCPIRVADVTKDPRYVRFRHAEVEIRSELTVPLICQDRLIGVIDLESVELDHFTPEHEQVMSALAAHIAVALENARLYETLAANERRLEHELATARRIQTALLPRIPPKIEGLEIGTAYAAARELSGDFYDLLHLPSGHLVIALGDVAGKGTPAALYGALAVGMLRVQVLTDHEEPADMLRRMNEELVQLRVERRFVALVFGILDPAHRRLTLTNSGVPPPRIARSSGLEEVTLNALPLGSMAQARYPQAEIVLAPGNAVVLVSDGLEDCRNAQGEPFAPRLDEIVAAAARKTARERSAQEIADLLITESDRHQGSGEPADDRTVVVLRFTD